MINSLTPPATSAFAEGILIAGRVLYKRLAIATGAESSIQLASPVRDGDGDGSGVDSGRGQSDYIS
jgi:hypothetical protein